VAVADALRGLLPRAAGDRVGIHWPNDVVIGPGKVAGILVEQDDRLARIGIGLNVLDRPWPPGVRGASVASAGGPADRLAVLERLLVELDRGLAAPMAEVVAAWDAASGLRGRLVRYDGVDGGTIEGIAGGLDGLGRLRVVDPADGTVRLVGPSATGGPVEA